MIKRENELATAVLEKMRGGNGSVGQVHFISEEQFCGHGRLFARMTLEPGCSIGWHVHNEESETYHILRGTARYSDNGTEVTLNPGDVSYTASGEGHAIENAGSDTLELIALIVKA